MTEKGVLEKGSEPRMPRKPRALGAGPTHTEKGNTEELPFSELLEVGRCDVVSLRPGKLF